MKRKVPVILSMLLAAGITSPALTVNAAPSFNPYKTIQAEAKFGESGVEVTTEASGAKVVSSIDKGDYFYVKDVNFSEGLSKITISAKTDGPAVIEVRKGGAEGEVLGNIKLSNTNGEYKDFSASMKNVEGKDTIAFVGAAGTASIDYWTAEAGVVIEPCPGDVDPEEPQPENPQPENPTVTVNPYAAVEAESAQDKHFAADLSKDGVNYLGIKANGYIVFKDVDFSNGAAGLVANAKSDRPNTALELHIDSLDSQALTSVKIKSMSAFGESAQEFTSDITGKHDVYLVAKTGTVNLDSWYITPATTTTPEEPTPEEPKPENPVVTDPYSDFQAEAANVKEAATDATAGDATYTSIKANGYIAFKDVDLTKGISGVMLNAKSAAPNTTVDVRVDGVDGQSLGKVKIMSMGAFKNAAVKIDSTLTGKHDLYLVVTNGVADIDTLKVMPGKATPTPVTPDPVTPDPVTPAVTDPYSDFQAEAANVKESETDATVGDVTYTSIQKNGYIAFKDVDLTQGIAGVILNAKSAAPNTTVDVRVDGLDGQSLGTVKIMSMGTFKEAAVKIDSTIAGKHDIYLVVTNGVADIDSLKVLPGKTTPDPVTPDPVDPEPVDPNPVNPEPVDPNPVVTEGLNVRYEINSWGTGYVVNFFIDNKSGSTTNGWTVKIRKDQVSIDNSWCVNIREEGDYYVITPLDWNKNIANGQSIQFGIIGSGSIGNTLDVTVQ